MTLGVAGCVLSAAAAAPGAGPAAVAAGRQTGWAIVPSPSGPAGGNNTLMQVSAGLGTNAWAVGYDGFAGNFRTLAERWNGARWVLVPSPSPSPLDNVLSGVATVARASAWAVGYDVHAVSGIGLHRALIERWTGRSWRVVPTPRAGTGDSGLWGVTALSATNAWAVGNQNAGTVTTFRFRPLIEHWTGHAWTLVPVPSPPLTGVGASLFGIAATSPRNIWAVGNYDTGTRGHRFQPLIEHYDGAHWARIPAATAGSAQLDRISLRSPTDGWAVGIRGAYPHTQALIEHWNGRHWAVVPSPVIPGSGLADVLALTPRLAWAAGSYSPRNGVSRTLIERWNGHAWTRTPSPNRRPSSELLGIAGTQHLLWAVGDSFPTSTSTLILRH